MNPIPRPEGMNFSASSVFDMMAAIATDADIDNALIEDGLMHAEITAALSKVLTASALDIDVGLIEVRTCNYPLAQYDRDFSLRGVDYRSSLYLRAGGWLFDSDSFLCPQSQAGLGFAAFPDEASAVARDVARRFKPGCAWYHEVAPKPTAGSPRTKTIGMVASAIQSTLALHMGRQMQRDTLAPGSRRGLAPRF